MPNFHDVAGSDHGSARVKLFQALRDRGPLSRAQLARATGLAPSTITGLVKSVADEGLIVEQEPRTGRNRSGPKSRGIALHPGLGSVLGLEFGYATVRALLADLSGNEIGSTQVSLSPGYAPEVGMRSAASLLASMSEWAPTAPPLSGIGIAFPGLVDSSDQTIVTSSILRGWSGISAMDLAEALGAPCTIENDANLAALGEHSYGAGRGSRSSLTVKFHSGIGAGLILDGRLVTGPHGGAAEIGHIEVDPLGPVCRCGKRGCLDTFASVESILRTLRPERDTTSVDQLAVLVQLGDAGTERVVSDAAGMVGKVVANAALMFAPERIVVVGSLSQLGSIVLNPIADALARNLLPEAPHRPDVVAGILGRSHTTRGAAAMALRSLGWLS